ncbi:21080_t:CDS:2, partial [Entrophospora sp. SA101]
ITENNRSELLGRRHNTNTPEHPYQNNINNHVNNNMTREQHALREHEFINDTETKLDEYIAHGREVLHNIYDQNNILKNAQRKMLDAANTLGLSRNVIQYIERRMSQDKWVFIEDIRLGDFGLSKSVADGTIQLSKAFGSHEIFRTGDLKKLEYCTKIILTVLYFALPTTAKLKVSDIETYSLQSNGFQLTISASKYLFENTIITVDLQDIEVPRTVEGFSKLVKAVKIILSWKARTRRNTETFYEVLKKGHECLKNGVFFRPKKMAIV